MQPLKFMNGYGISSHTLLSMWLLIHAGIKVLHVSKGATGHPLPLSGRVILVVSVKSDIQAGEKFFQRSVWGGGYFEVTELISPVR